ncbi:MAG: alginate lyase family protein [Cyclobacterium sp.]|uniref:alginate lyase family protein n=1 Tax=unclassified Cyclobacterium TaxID=2615055 RepID=UPI0013CFDC29|nr:alginate lyase family protein [Cyclobacterium sp. SYSU L10401]
MVKRIIVFWMLLFTPFLGISQSKGLGQLIILEADVLKGVKQKLTSEQDKAFPVELKQLMDRADEKLTKGPFSVVHKTQVPPSGDKHDYISMGTYWWPDPDTDDGLPYIRKDGQANPEIYEYQDQWVLEEMMNAMEVLAMAYYFTEEEKYGAHAIALLHSWFLDPETRMNPNLNFGQRIPGITEGRRSGIIDTRSFVLLPDLITLLSASSHWQSSYEKGMKEWLGSYGNWLITSKHGKEEAVHGNNHSTWYYTQLIPMMIYSGQLERADSLVQRGIPMIMDRMIAKDGGQPEELGRTRTWDYSTMNLKAMLYFAKGCEYLGRDLWEYKNEEGAGLKEALAFLAPYAKGEKSWEYKQILDLEPEKLKNSLNIGAFKYQNEEFKKIADQLITGNGEFIYWDLAEYDLMSKE